MKILSAELHDLIELATALCSLFAGLTAYANRRHIKELHVQINSRMDQLLKSTASAATAAGRQLERTDRVLQTAKDTSDRLSNIETKKEGQ